MLDFLKNRLLILTGPNLKLTLFLLLLTYHLLATASEVILIGDTGKDNDGQREVSLALKKSCDEEACSFGILTGDNIYPEGMTSKDDPVLEKMFDKHYNPLKIPFLIALGNHDYGKRANDWKRGAWQVEHGKKNQYFYIPHFWYTYETEEAVIAVIDTSRIFWKEDRAEQAAMLNKTQELALSKNKWMIVVGHHPYFSNGEHGNAGTYEGWSFPYFVSGIEVKKFIDKHICGKVDFYLSGHDHNLQVFDKKESCQTRFIISGAGAATTPFKGNGPSLFQSDSLGFFRLSVHREKLRVRALDKNLQSLFDVTYRK